MRQKKKRLEISPDSGYMYSMAQNRVPFLKYFTFCEDWLHLSMDIFSGCTSIPIPAMCV